MAWGPELSSPFGPSHAVTGQCTIMISEMLPWFLPLNKKLESNKQIRCVLESRDSKLSNAHFVSSVVF